MYIYQINVLIEGDENPALEQQLEAALPLEVVSARTIQMTGENFGKCARCEAWVSDFRRKDAVREFSPGAKMDGKWLCDLCLPKDHPSAF